MPASRAWAFATTSSTSSTATQHDHAGSSSSGSAASTQPSTPYGSRGPQREALIHAEGERSENVRQQPHHDARGTREEHDRHAWRDQHNATSSGPRRRIETEFRQMLANHLPRYLSVGVLSSPSSTTSSPRPAGRSHPPIREGRARRSGHPAPGRTRRRPRPLRSRA